MTVASIITTEQAQNCDYLRLLSHKYTLNSVSLPFKLQLTIKTENKLIRMFPATIKRLPVPKNSSQQCKVKLEIVCLLYSERW